MQLLKEYGIINLQIEFGNCGLKMLLRGILTGLTMQLILTSDIMADADILNRTVSKNSKGVLPCTAKNGTSLVDLLTIFWFKSTTKNYYTNGAKAILSYDFNEHTIHQTDKRINLSSDYSLIIENTSKENMGIYRCKVQGIGGSDQSDVRLVIANVTDAPDDLTTAPASIGMTQDYYSIITSSPPLSPNSDYSPGKGLIVASAVIGTIIFLICALLITAFFCMKYEAVPEGMKRLCPFLPFINSKGRGANGSVKSTDIEAAPLKQNGTGANGSVKSTDIEAAPLKQNGHAKTRAVPA